MNEADAARRALEYGNAKTLQLMREAFGDLNIQDDHGEFRLPAHVPLEKVVESIAPGADNRQTPLDPATYHED